MDESYGVGEALARYVELCLQTVEMPFGKQVEMMGNYFFRSHRFYRLRQSFELEQQAVAQVYSPDTGRVESAYGIEYASHIAVVDIYSLRDGNIVGDVAQRACEIAVVVEIADDMLGNAHITFVEVVLRGKAAH